MQVGRQGWSCSHGFLPGVDNDLKVEIIPVGLLHVSIINPLGSGDVREMLEHDKVLTLYVCLSVSLLLALFLLVPDREARGEGGEAELFLPDVRVLRAGGRSTVNPGSG